MLKKPSDPKPSLAQRISSRLTPRELKALLFIAGLFALGAAVKWARTGRLP
jgi:hypothetical protein